MYFNSLLIYLIHLFSFIQQISFCLHIGWMEIFSNLTLALSYSQRSDQQFPWSDLFSRPAQMDLRLLLSLSALVLSVPRPIYMNAAWSDKTRTSLSAVSPFWSVCNITLLPGAEGGLLAHLKENKKMWPNPLPAIASVLLFLTLVILSLSKMQSFSFNNWDPGMLFLRFSSTVCGSSFCRQDSSHKLLYSFLIRPQHIILPLR